MSSRTKFFEKQPTEKPKKSKKVIDSTFGNIISDLGHKYLYKSKISDLGWYNKIKIWEKQRALNKERVNLIYEYQKNRDEIDFIGTIIFCEYDGIYYIVDGYHRFEAMKLLFKDDLDVEFISEVYFNQTKADVQTRFIEINKAEPVSLDHFDNTGIVSEIVCKFTKRYPSAFKYTQVYRPNISIDSFKEGLCKIMAELDIKDSDDLYEKLKKQNNVYKLEYSKKDFYKVLSLMTTMKKESFDKVHKKAEKKGIFFGLFANNEWVDHIIDRYKDIDLISLK